MTNRYQSNNNAGAMAPACSSNASANRFNSVSLLDIACAVSVFVLAILAGIIGAAGVRVLLVVSLPALVLSLLVIRTTEYSLKVEPLS